MTHELELLEVLPPDADHAAAERVLTEAGWSPCGVGDWAVVLASPSGSLVARICPFDPVAPYTAELFRRAADTGQVPVLHAYVELEGGAVCTVMERLHPVERDRAVAFFHDLDEPTPALERLARVLDEVYAEARRDLPWCGPIDPNPTNVMRRAGGELVLTDPFYADGPNLYGSLAQHPMAVARLIPEEARRHMFDLPMAESGPFDPHARAAMEAGLRAADARLRAERAG
jgi:hypothetical protein